jgi:hypothetical protein
MLPAAFSCAHRPQRWSVRPLLTLIFRKSAARHPCGSSGIRAGRGARDEGSVILGHLAAVVSEHALPELEIAGQSLHTSGTVSAQLLHARGKLSARLFQALAG